MSRMTTNLQQLFRHNLWANRLILDACAQLSPVQPEASVVGTHGSVGRTLAQLGERRGLLCCSSRSPAAAISMG